MLRTSHIALERVRQAMTRFSLTAVVAFAALGPAAAVAMPDDARQIRDEASQALQHLYASTPGSAELGEKAVAVLVFPKIYKAGFLIGGEHGQGVLFKGKEVAGYYDISAMSLGLQAGAQMFSYALFFMNHTSLAYLDKSDGWALGSGPSVVLWDRSFASSVSTTTLTQDVFAVPFGGQGLMAGMGLEGSKISPSKP
ncbi:twin-arginine translocation pathway signal protein [Bordetella genomosp. 12]|uniref:Twin-arginine translocation pathway signal protein n=1 Tax=Bordetella genomosp. 12 TaxID=463035 RepID=A0A261VLV0_9BORD|nr:twin-arginine translocation pathway signal protein [Bordetella genomosp. 12]OZI75096.1 twin-arginine translocation pathway signal protein [Bordetella genomosp. 12]